MALIVRTNDKSNSTSLTEFLIQSVAEVASLPTDLAEGAGGLQRVYPGSVAYTPDLEHIYMLGQDSVWHEV